jgi:hypothetical protein
MGFFDRLLKRAEPAKGGEPAMKPVFMEWLRLNWYPALRVSGFKGSGTHFRRIRGAFAHCINIQAKSDGTACCVNLGAEPRLQPVRGFSEPVDFSRIKELDCEIRDRLKRSNEADSWWTFGTNEEEAARSASSLVEVWNTRGEDFFKNFVELPGRIAAATVADFQTGRSNVFLTTKVRAVLLCARVSLEVGDCAKARAFSEYGLTICQRTALDATFKDIIGRCQDNKDNA